ncbi:hypothetical protein ACH4SP_41125 [Streptomyces sp. NPDC021093]|uniref:hypothetical protein n=1 Tax=Streptomyces sp. NPDC021093 TaxID=3365112 RepID=UPI00379A4B0C
MRTRALFSYVLIAAGVTVGLSACGSGGPESYSEATEAMTERDLHDAMLRNKEVPGYAVGPVQRTEHANLPAWRTGDAKCAPLLDALGPGTLGAVRSAYVTVGSRTGGVQPMGLKLGTYDSDGARRAMDKLSGALGSCRTFDLTGPLNRAYRVSVELPSGPGSDTGTTYVLNAQPVDARNGPVRHEVHAVRTGSLTSVATVDDTLRALPGSPPVLGADQVKSILDRQVAKLKRPVDEI